MLTSLPALLFSVTSNCMVLAAVLRSTLLLLIVASGSGAEPPGLLLPLLLHEKKKRENKKAEMFAEKKECFIWLQFKLNYCLQTM